VISGILNRSCAFDRQDYCAAIEYKRNSHNKHYGIYSYMRCFSCGPLYFILWVVTTRKFARASHQGSNLNRQSRSGNHAKLRHLKSTSHEKAVNGNGTTSGFWRCAASKKAGLAIADLDAFTDRTIRHDRRSQPMCKIHDETVFEQGYFVRPTMVTELPEEAPLMIEENSSVLSFRFPPTIPWAMR
jgi:hypothetical protein